MCAGSSCKSVCVYNVTPEIFPFSSQLQNRRYSCHISLVRVGRFLEQTTVRMITILNLKTISSLARLTGPFSQQGSKLSDQHWRVWRCARSTGRVFFARKDITVQKAQTFYYCAKSTDMLQYDKMERDEPLCACGSDCSPVFGQHRSDFTGSSRSCCEANHRNVKCSLSSTAVHPFVCQSQPQTTVFGYSDLNKQRLWNGEFCT